MTPGFKFLGGVFLVALLSLAAYNGAHAAEPDEACMLVMQPEAAQVARRREAGVPGALNRYLIRSEPRYGEAGRWLLLRFLDALEAGRSSDPNAILGALCAIPNMPAAAPIYRSEFDKPKDI